MFYKHIHVNIYKQKFYWVNCGQKRWMNLTGSEVKTEKCGNLICLNF